MQILAFVAFGRAEFDPLPGDSTLTNLLESQISGFHRKIEFIPIQIPDW